MKKIAVIDYGMGNLRSVAKAVEHVVEDQTKVIVTSSINDVRAADRIVFPGQGAAKECMLALKEHDLIDVLLEVARTKPFLGICMGLQVLMSYSQENSGTECLGLFEGSVEYFGDSISNTALKIPHMGWNQVQHTAQHPLWAGIEDNSRFYFVHSYYIKPKDSELVVGETSYDIKFVSALAQENIFAVQFHPEKSADAGLTLLKNFTNWNGCV